VETGGRDDHVRRTRSLSRRALGSDRDPGWFFLNIHSADERISFMRFRRCTESPPKLRRRLWRASLSSIRTVQLETISAAGRIFEGVIRLPGRARRKPLKPLRRECRVNRCNRGDYACVLFYIAREAAGASGARHSLRPLIFRRRDVHRKSRANMPRDREAVSANNAV
jgi:hypothetical protein